MSAFLEFYPAEQMVCECGGAMKRHAMVLYPGHRIEGRYKCAQCGRNAWTSRPLEEPEPPRSSTRIAAALRLLGSGRRPAGSDETRKTLELIESHMADVISHLEITAILHPDSSNAELKRRSFLVLMQVARLLERRTA